jgi:hypothetical protein
VLAPGILEIGDVPHLAALCAPRKVLIAEPRPLHGQPPGDAFAFTRAVYRVHQRDNALTIMAELRARDEAAAL